MIRKNLLESPVFSCFWLAGIVLAGSATAGDETQKSNSGSIIPQWELHSKSPGRRATRLTEFAEISEGISIAKLGPRQIASNLSVQQDTLPDTDAAKPNSPTPADDPVQPLFAPLSSVTLGGSTRSESLEGQALRVPNDQASPIIAESGTWHDVSGYRTIPGARHNQYPVWYNPLYFEDPNMERCGVSDGCLTDFVSATRFFGRTALLPYMIGSSEPHCCVRSLGDCPSCHQFGKDAYIAPLNAKGVALQTACTVGLVFLIP